MPEFSPRVWLCAHLVGLVLAALAMGNDAAAAVTAPKVSIYAPSQPGNRVALETSSQAGALLRLEASSDLGFWKELGRTHDGFHRFPDLEVPAVADRYYRIRASERVPSDDWKNQLLFPEEVFRPDGEWGSVRWVKFAILKNEPWRVYYQDSIKYPFHYDFATTRFAPFQGMTRAAFDAVSLHRANQQVVLGAVLYPPRPNFVEFGVQFAGLDAYSPDEIAQWFEAVKATVHADSGAEALYMPAFEQSETARQKAPEFAARGLTVASLDRWLASNHCYSTGWALGRLKFFPAAQIEAAFTDGRLVPQDILLTDGVPAETPLVAGIISLTPSTPNSHTAILAQSFGIPFVHLPAAADRARVQQMVGHKVILRAIVEFDLGLVKVIDLGEGLDPAVESELLALKQPIPIEYTPKASFGAISASTQNLTPADIRFFGGKAANYGLLRRTVPNNCPQAIAFSFDLWDAFLEQTMPGGLTLRAEIAARLAPHSTYPPQIAAMKTSLAAIRTLITNAASFTPAQKQSIIAALGSFTPGRKIRFRSSTNVEDAQTFTGAGLYDSYSGCLADDLDGDETGPCACEATEPDERSVFLAIRRVYASFYNDNAFLERRRHSVDESKVGMGLLVHHSFPDHEELANGVAALDYRYTFSTTMNGQLVTQRGAESVTNPDGTALPEVVDAFVAGNISDLRLRQHSSRIPLGGHVLNWQEDYLTFTNLFKTVGNGYRQLFPARTTFSLDFEYKKDLNLGLVVKQVREIPATGPSAPVTAFIIDDPTEWIVAQKEAGDVFGNHRLKSIWHLHTVSKRLTPATLAAGLYATGSVTFVEASALQTLTGPLAGWPGASHTPDGTTNRWTTGNGPLLRRWELKNTLKTSVTGDTPPIFTATDFPTTLTVTYPAPVPTMDYFGRFEVTDTDFVVLEPRREVTPGSILVQRNIDNGKGVTVETSFYWPDEPPLAAGYTAPLVRFQHTRITGLTSQPIVLTGYYSQTYRPEHHNFTEKFIFEPRLDPAISPAILAELAAANIMFLHVTAGEADAPMVVAGFDQQLRKL